MSSQRNRPVESSVGRCDGDVPEHRAGSSGVNSTRTPPLAGLPSLSTSRPVRVAVGTKRDGHFSGIPVAAGRDRDDGADLPVVCWIKTVRGLPGSSPPIRAALSL